MLIPENEPGKFLGFYGQDILHSIKILMATMLSWIVRITLLMTYSLESWVFCHTLWWTLLTEACLLCVLCSLTKVLSSYSSYICILLTYVRLCTKSFNFRRFEEYSCMWHFVCFSVSYYKAVVIFWNSAGDWLEFSITIDLPMFLVSGFLLLHYLATVLYYSRCYGNNIASDQQKKPRYAIQGNLILYFW